jgi:CheY-like chemotaxis protein
VVSGGEREVRVLVVDDEQVVHASLRKILAKERYCVDAVLTAKEALARLAAERYDLVIADLMMPGMSGIGLLRAARARGVAVPVVMITGYPTIRTAVQAIRLGAIDYIAKPFTRRELLGPVRRALSLKALSVGKSAVAPSITVDLLLPGTELYIPHHAWARFEQDGAFLVGLEASFLNAVGGVRILAVPEASDLVEQGHLAVRVSSGCGGEHGVAMPLSGQVLAVNRAALWSEAELHADTWLLRLMPTQLDQELELLVLR